MELNYLADTNYFKLLFFSIIILAILLVIKKDNKKEEKKEVKQKIQISPTVQNNINAYQKKAKKRLRRDTIYGVRIEKIEPKSTNNIEYETKKEEHESIEKNDSPLDRIIKQYDRDFLGIEVPMGYGIYRKAFKV